MAIGSGIEWTEATWNPATGCSKISPGCANCYAEKLSKRLQLMNLKKYQKGFRYVEHYNEINTPLKWTKPRRIFVNSMSDLFHEHASIDFIRKCFFVMIKAHQHTYQVLTKRPEKMRKFSYLFEKEFDQKIPLYIWMGVSIESQNYDWRIEELRGVECFTRFISFEPLLGPIENVNLKGIDWAIIGGESGYGYRGVKGEWIRSLIKQCKKQKVPVFFKQWGGPRPKSGGREIDGKTFDEYPTITITKKIRKQLDELKENVYAMERKESLQVFAQSRWEHNLVQIATIRSK